MALAAIDRRLKRELKLLATEGVVMLLRGCPASNGLSDTSMWSSVSTWNDAGRKRILFDDTPSTLHVKFTSQTNPFQISFH